MKLVNSIISEISKGYEAIGQSALPEAIIKRMKEAINTDKDLSEFTTAEASAAIDYLTKIKLNIPKPNKTA